MYYAHTHMRTMHTIYEYICTTHTTTHTQHILQHIHNTHTYTVLQHMCCVVLCTSDPSITLMNRDHKTKWLCYNQ